MMEIKLKQCPCCGTEAYTHFTDLRNDELYGFISCNNSECALKMNFSIKPSHILLNFDDVINGIYDVVDKWNKRTNGGEIEKKRQRFSGKVPPLFGKSGSAFCIRRQHFGPSAPHGAMPGRAGTGRFQHPPPRGRGEKLSEKATEKPGKPKGSFTLSACPAFSHPVLPEKRGARSMRIVLGLHATDDA